MRTFAFALLFIPLAGLSFPETASAQKQPDKDSPFADKNLEAAIRDVLKHSKGPLDDKNLANVYILHASGKEIKDLKGLDKCRNLAELRLAKNHIKDIGPLKELKNLQSLSLGDNQISDLGPLADLAAL